MGSRCRHRAIRGDNGRVQSATPRDRWTILVPLKASDRGKSRIEVDPALRRRLVLAMALDTVAAAAAADGVRQVVVVVDEPADATSSRGSPASGWCGPTPPSLNQAIVDGARAMVGDADGRRRSGRSPCSRATCRRYLPGELAAALSAAARHPRAVVADKQGTGTTLLAGVGRVDCCARGTGPGSLGRHLADGAVGSSCPVDSGLRRDVDHGLADLPDVTGPRTVAVLRARLDCAREWCASRPAV